MDGVVCGGRFEVEGRDVADRLLFVYSSDFFVLLLLIKTAAEVLFE